MFYTYIIKSISTGKIYIGQTSALEARIVRHNSGGSLYTKNKGPWELLYFYEFSTRSEAVLLERKLKGFKSSKKVLLWVERQS
jgi:putative endonuclease